MADVQPLRGVRFDPRRSGPVGPLIAPPYDVATEPAASIGFSIRSIEGVDLGHCGNDHDRAAERYRAWLAQGVLRRDPVPMIYLHRHLFDANGVTVSRTGLIARVRLADWADRIVLPHERTTSGPRQERLERLRAVHANLSPLYFLYRDTGGEIRDLIAEHAPPERAPDALDQMGGAHGLAPIAETAFHAKLARAFAKRTLFVADGHHRYEAALAFRDECRETYGEDPDAPAEFVLVLLAAVEDPGVVVWPTHRLLVGTHAFSADSILGILRRWFDIRRVEESTAAADGQLVCRVVVSGDRGIWRVHAKPGNPHELLLPRDRGPAWRSLGVVAVEGVLESLFGVDNPLARQHVLPVVDEQDAMTRVRDRRAEAAFLLPAPDLNQLLAVAEQGDLLPAKSTWFEPKAPAGLVINDLSAGDRGDRNGRRVKDGRPR